MCMCAPCRGDQPDPPDAGAPAATATAAAAIDQAVRFARYSGPRFAPPFDLKGFADWVRVVDVHDGDTVTAVAELFPGRFHALKVRLAGIDTPELHGGTEATRAAAWEAQRALFHMCVTGGAPADALLPLPLSQPQEAALTMVPRLAYLRSAGPDKYGRTLGTLSAGPDAAPDESYNARLLAMGHAVAYDGGARKRAS